MILIMNVILAVDTATEFCSVALSAYGQMFVSEKLAPQKHAALVLDMISEVLAQANASKQDIEAIGFGRGPGSFTGVRIATSVAQALALGLDKKVFGFDNLKLLAYAALESKNCPYVLSSIDARMGEVYFALYKKEGERLQEIVTTQVKSPKNSIELITQTLHSEGIASELLTDKVAVAGTGIAILKEHGLAINESEVLYPKAATILKVGQIEGYDLVDAAEAEPLYCRNEVTWKKINEQ